MLEGKVNNILPVGGCQVEQRGESPSLPVVSVENSSGVMRFKECAQFITSIMPRTSCGEAGATERYWLEIKDPKHRDRISLVGHDSKSGALSAWKEDTTNKAGLFEWMDQHPDVEIRHRENDPKLPLSQHLGYVNYLTKNQATVYQVALSQGEWKTGEGVLLDTTHLAGKAGFERHAAIVIHRDGTIFVNPHETGKWHHTSTTGGRPVLAAGMILIEQGEAKSFHLESGHYDPKRPQLEHLLARLVAGGVNIEKLDIHAKAVTQDDVKSLVRQYSS